MMEIVGVGLKGRRGYTLRAVVLERLYALMAQPETAQLDVNGLAAALGVARSTVYNYLIPEVVAEMARRRQAMLAESEIVALDKALYVRALGGDLGAAKLIYARWDKTGGGSGAGWGDLPTNLAEIDAELERLGVVLE